MSIELKKLNPVSDEELRKLRKAALRNQALKILTNMKNYNSPDNETKDWETERDEKFIKDYIENQLNLLEEKDRRLNNPE